MTASGLTLLLAAPPSNEQRLVALVRALVEVEMAHALGEPGAGLVRSTILGKLAALVRRAGSTRSRQVLSARPGTRTRSG